MSFDFIQINRDPNIFICHRLDKKTMMINIYIDNFLFTSNYLSILNILKKVRGRKYSIKDFGKV